MNSGPWGPWNGSSGDNKDDKNTDAGKQETEKDSNKNKPKKSVADFDDFFKKAENFFKKIFSAFDNKNSENNSSDKNKNFPKSLVGLVILGIILLWTMFGFYKVDPDENAVTLYFGKFYSITTPGLNYHLPFPLGKVIKKSVTTVNTEEFGFSSSSVKKYDKRNFDAESLMLTGDENIVDIEFQVQWQIADIKDFVFNIAQPNQAIRKSAESAMREIIARTPIADALSDGKKKIELEAKTLLQQILDSYGAGIRITLVQLRRVDPPSQVIDAFRDVQTAKADKEKEINQAQSYANDIIPRARGTAAQMKEQSEAFLQEAVSNAEGEAGRFLTVYNQYSKSKQVTKKRLYLETMEKIYRDMDKIIIDKNSSKSAVTPYFPLNDLPSSNQTNSTPKK